MIQLEQLCSVVQKYAFELNLGADILEFIGVVAQKIHQYAIGSQTVINDLLSDESFELWMFKILELEQLEIIFKKIYNIIRRFNRSAYNSPIKLLKVTHLGLISFATTQLNKIVLVPKS